MKVVVRFWGPLAQEAGEERVEFILQPGATWGLLLGEIGRRFGPRLHKRFWDHDVNAFRSGILVVGAGRDLDSEDSPLRDGEEIKIIPILAGG